MSENYLALVQSPEQRRAHQVAFSVQVLSEIASNYNARIDGDDLLAASTMVDAYYVNIRLMSEFLCRSEPPKADFGPRDFGVDWVPPDLPAVERLCALGDVASKYVVHFSSRRVPDSLEGMKLFPVSEHDFRTGVEAVLEIYDRFVAAVEATVDWSHDARVPDRRSDPDGWAAANRAGMARVLRQALSAARTALG